MLSVMDGSVVAMSELGGGAPGAGSGYPRVEQLAVRARELAMQISVLQAELVSVAAEIETDLADFLGGTTPRWWLAHEAGLDNAEAGQLCEAAAAIERCPRVFEELRIGRISLGSFRRLARVASPANEEEILTTVASASAPQLEIFVRDVARSMRDAEPSADRPDRVSWGFGRDGRWRIRGDVSPELGATMDAALAACRASLIASGPAHDVEPGRETPSPLDVFTEAAERALFAEAVEGRLPDHHQVVVHCDLGTFLAAHGVPVEEPVAGWIQGGGWVGPGFVGSILASSSIRFLLETVRGDPVFLTKPSRVATANQLRALWGRDRGCQWEDCGRTDRLRAHHIQWASHGGPTQLDNLVLLCPYHHRKIHVDGWGIRRDADTGAFTVIRPDGRPYDPCGRRWWLPPPAPPPPVGVERATGCGDRATHYARDVIVAAWTRAA